MKYLLLFLIACAHECPVCPTCPEPKTEYILIPNPKVPKNAQSLFEPIKIKKKKK